MENKFYLELINQYSELIRDEKDFLTNAANLNALIYHNLPNLNWVGFYMMKDGELVLSTFQGKTACVRIEVGKGVCGKCVEWKKTLIVDNVHNFEGHIACDSASNSEITIPIVYKDKIIGVYDVDSPIFSRFTADENSLFDELLKLLLNKSNVDRFINYYKAS